MRGFARGLAALACILGVHIEARAQGNLTDPLPVIPEVRPIDDLLCEQLKVFFAERDKAEEQYGRPTKEWYEAGNRANPARVLGKAILEFARQRPGSPESLQCLSYLIDWTEGEPGTLHRAAWVELLKHQKDDLALVWLCSRCTNAFSVDANEYALKRLLAESTNPRVQASAAFHLAQLYDGTSVTRPATADIRRRFEADGLLAAEPHVFECLERRKVGDLVAERDKYLALVKDKYSEEKSYGADRQFGRLNYTFMELDDAPTFGELAAKLEHEIAHLRVGGDPGDFAAKDVTGEDFSLAAQRGRPVIVLFSFKGCGPCEAFYPDLREIQAKYAPRGLEVVAVMADEKADTVRETIANGDITWRCIWEGDGGPIAKQFHVQGYPTVYLLNPEGRVATTVRDPVVLERELEAMLPKASPTSP
jgi:thiol-disulfide isomerase/thioredoxin